MFLLRTSSVRVALGFLLVVMCGTPMRGAELGYFVFEGVIEEADAVFGERMRPGWTFSGALEAPEDLSAPPVSFEYTLDHDHLLEWEGALLADTPPSRGRAEDGWIYFRLPVLHVDATSGGMALGWVEFWLPEVGFDFSDGRQAVENGYFSISVWMDAQGAFAGVSGALSYFAAGDPEDDLEARVDFMETWASELHAENEELRAERDRLRAEVSALRDRVAGMEELVDYLLREKEALRERAESIDAARTDTVVKDLRSMVHEKTATTALLKQERDFLRDESLRMAESLAVCESENLRLREQLERLERKHDALRSQRGAITASPRMFVHETDIPDRERGEDVAGEAAPSAPEEVGVTPPVDVEKKPSVEEDPQAASPRGGLRRGSRRR